MTAVEDVLADALEWFEEAHQYPVETDDGLRMRCLCGAVPPSHLLGHQVDEGLWLWEHFRAERTAHVAAALAAAGIAHTAAAEARGAERVVAAVERIAGGWPHEYKRAAREAARNAGGGRAECPHGEPEGDCASCAACAACRGECGVCPYVTPPPDCACTWNSGDGRPHGPACPARNAGGAR